MIKVRDKKEEYIEYIRNYKPILEIPPYNTPFEIEQLSPIEEIVVTSHPFEPRNFTEFIGQDASKDVLKIIIDSANKEKRFIPNILLTGPYGHGKTTLAKLIVKRHKRKIQLVDASVAGAIISSSKETIYIIDEAHNLPAQIADSYNILLDSSNLRLIACTTNPGALPLPFRSRFRSIYLQTYTTQEIKKIVQRAAHRASINIYPKATEIIAQKSKLNPRNALNLLEFIRELTSLTKKPVITKEDVLIGTAKLGIDTLGLTELDRKYLSLLSYDKPVGLQFLSAALSTDIETIQLEIEPYLIQIRLIERTARGRLLVNQRVREIMETLNLYKTYRKQGIE